MRTKWARKSYAKRRARSGRKLAKTGVVGMNFCFRAIGIWDGPHGADLLQMKQVY
jgi:hypothetical protein